MTDQQNLFPLNRVNSSNEGRNEDESAGPLELDYRDIADVDSFRSDYRAWQDSAHGPFFHERSIPIPIPMRPEPELSNSRQRREDQREIQTTSLMNAAVGYSPLCASYFSLCAPASVTVPTNNSTIFPGAASNEEFIHPWIHSLQSSQAAQRRQQRPEQRLDDHPYSPSSPLYLSRQNTSSMEANPPSIDSNEDMECSEENDYNGINVNPPSFSRNISNVSCAEWNSIVSNSRIMEYYDEPNAASFHEINTTQRCEEEFAATILQQQSVRNIRYIHI
jgi:hypothetical protein